MFNRLSSLYIKWLPLLRWSPVGLLVVVALYLWVSYPHFVIDDAFITARYAKNLALHGELNWNVGQDAVEGYTGILLPLLLAPFLRLGVEFMTLAPLYGMAGFLATGLLIWRMLEKYRAPLVLTFSVTALYALAPFLFPHIFAGLETFVYIYLITRTLALLLAALNRQLKQTWLLPLTAFLAALSRPEGVLLGGLALLAWGVFLLINQRSYLKRYFFEVIAACGLPGVLYFLWRWQYYGYLLPNTYYAKHSGYNPSVLEDFFTFLNDFNLFPLLLVGICGVFWLVGWLMSRRANQKPSPADATAQPGGLLYLALTIAAFMALNVSQYMNSILKVGYSHRFFAPFFPLILFFLGTVAVRAYRAWEGKRTLQYGLLALVAGLSLWQIAALYPQEYFHEKRIFKAYETFMEYEHIAIGKMLKEKIPANEWLVVIMDAGAMPYYSELPTIDTSLLNDEVLTHGLPAGTTHHDYYFSKNPGVFVMTSYSFDELQKNQGTLDLVNDARFSKNYQLVERYRAPLPENAYYSSYYEFVYFRKDLVK